jgi:hypothetical protein
VVVVLLLLLLLLQVSFVRLPNFLIFVSVSVLVRTIVFSKGIIHRDLKLENFLFSSKAEDSELKMIGESFLHWRRCRLRFHCWCCSGFHFNGFRGTNFVRIFIAVPVLTS